MKSTLKEGKLDERDTQDLMDSVYGAYSEIETALTILTENEIDSGPIYDRIQKLHEELDSLAEEVRVKYTKKYRGRSSY